ncbi:MAG TPA: TIGR03560 family F420-dependent LLM class oxidoreductase [Acidimicrobiales bacterium]|jgi:F420-dependent oxidoreductase-like protein|nr:TIGR03560 family F420-dependent LLM class oxidoreductase [Acidimicrobiales bacterium]
MRFSLWTSPHQPWSEVLTAARHADATGWDGVWVADHFMPDQPGPFPPDTPTLEAGSLLAALGAATERVRVGPLVLGNTYRHPAVVANMAATIDHVTGGRFVLGLGAGWQVNEHEQYGIELPPPRERVDRFAEAVQVVRGLLTQPTTTFHGEHYRVTDALCEPKPVQARLPILVGGKGDRMLGVVARHADEWNTWGLPDHIAERSAALDRACERVGRDPAEIERSAQVLVFFTDDEEQAAQIEAAVPRPLMAGTPARMREVVDAYAAIGLDELILPDFTLGQGAQKIEAIDRFLEEVAAPHRG